MLFLFQFMKCRTQLYLNYNTLQSFSSPSKENDLICEVNDSSRKTESKTTQNFNILRICVCIYIHTYVYMSEKHIYVHVHEKPLHNVFWSTNLEIKHKHKGHRNDTCIIVSKSVKKKNNYWSYKLEIAWSLDCKPHWTVQLSNHTRMGSIIAAVTMDVDRNLKSAKDKHNKKIKPFQMAVQLPKNTHCHWRLAGLKRKDTLSKIKKL